MGLSDKEVKRMVVDFWNDHLEKTREIDIDEEDILRLNEFQKGNLDLMTLSFEQRTRLQKACIMGEELLCHNGNMFESNKKHNENADYCTFCNNATFYYMDRITDKKGTIFLCANCRRALYFWNLCVFEGDDDLECMLTGKRGAVSYSTEYFSKPLIVSPDILTRLLMHKLDKTEVKKIYDIYGDDEKMDLFFHLL